MKIGNFGSVKPCKTIQLFIFYPKVDFICCLTFFKYHLVWWSEVEEEETASGCSAGTSSCKARWGSPTWSSLRTGSRTRCCCTSGLKVAGLHLGKVGHRSKVGYQSKVGLHPSKVGRPGKVGHQSKVGPGKRRIAVAHWKTSELNLKQTSFDLLNYRTHSKWFHAEIAIFLYPFM